MARRFKVGGIPDVNWHVVGDSTMSGVEAYNGGYGSTNSGRGYTSGAPFGQIVLTPPEQPYVICGASAWDIDSSNLEGYLDAAAYYADLGTPVTWVEVPPSPGFSDATAFNAALADLLGVTLVGYSIRVSEFVDGLHYSIAGAITVVDRFTQLLNTSGHHVGGQGEVAVGGTDVDTWATPADIAQDYIYTGPTSTTRPTVSGVPAMQQEMAAWSEITTGRTVVKEAGVWTVVTDPTVDSDRLAAADAYYRGGYEHPVSIGRKAELEAAGVGGSFVDA